MALEKWIDPIKREHNKNDIVIISLAGMILSFGKVVKVTKNRVTVRPDEKYLAESIVFTKRKTGNWIASGYSQSGCHIGPDIDQEIPF